MYFFQKLHISADILVWFIIQISEKYLIFKHHYSVMYFSKIYEYSSTYYFDFGIKKLKINDIWVFLFRAQGGLTSRSSGISSLRMVVSEKKPIQTSIQPTI